jgi:SAM-dependent methyltransferase
MTSSESINFDRIADRYDETRGGEARGVQFAPDLAELLQTGEPVVEIGVGTGVVAMALRTHGFRVVGIDISEHMLARARDRIGPSVVRADALRLPFRDGDLEQALSVWVLHLVADVRVVMEEVARALRPGGRYLVMDGRIVDADNSDPIHAAMRDLETGLGRQPFAGRVAGYAREAEAAGLRVVDIVLTGPYLYRSSPADAARNIEQRTHSWMWAIPDDEWNRVAPPVAERLRAMPDPDMPMRRFDYQEILVVER